MTNITSKCVAILLLVFVVACSSPPSTVSKAISQKDLQARLDELQTANEDVAGFAVHIQFAEKTGVGAASGVANPESVAMTSVTPVRIASITKTFVAATMLRLWEDGKVDLDAPISALIAPSLDQMLKSDGYDTDVITVRHLLMHVSGMPDHAGNEYVEEIFNDPTKVWTRANQVNFLVSRMDPIGPSGAQFTYSDTGYILLGDIIERITQTPLHVAVRSQLSFSDISIDTAWWDVFEAKPANAPARAHQYLGGVDVHNWNGTIDAYGGGGLIASVKDLSVFFSALFEGDVFNSARTLMLMTEAPGHPAPDSYRIGLQTQSICGETIYSHSGFWGVLVVHLPKETVSIAGVALDQSGYRGLSQVMRDIAESLVAACEQT